jgi:acetoin utilization deacetylase AcuC-like enzyme
VSLAYISHDDCLKHDVDPDHPECPARLHAIRDQLISSGMEMALHFHDAPRVSREALLRVHDAAYLDALERRCPDEGLAWLDSDTALMRDTLLAARHAAGAVVLAVDLVMQGKADAAFCGVRPPGHHAERDRAMGFCYYNNIAVGAAHALAVHGLERIAIIDFDVHHGNGTEHIFSDNDRVLFCSSFQHPFYPFTGHESRAGHIINIPLPAGSDGAAFRARAEAGWLPALDNFAPQLVMISAGFDAHVEDDLAQLRLRESDYRWISGQLRTLARRHADGRIVSSLEGGYALNALGRCVVAHLDALLGHD